MDNLKKLFGVLDRNVRFIEAETGARIAAVEDGVALTGNQAEVDGAAALIKLLLRRIGEGAEIDKSKIKECMNMLGDGTAEQLAELDDSVVAITARGRRIRCRNFAQRDYVRAMQNNIITFGIGPAGTGKTFLAVAEACREFKEGKIEKIILTRPALEAGEKLGFLPGDLQMKIDPYLRPLYDALGEMFSDSYMRLMERGSIEVAPLAYMRGRTLSGAFIILDEAQNTTDEQMKMFLTRLGEGSKMAVTGDDSQVDLPRHIPSGLNRAASLLHELEDIAVCRFSERDVVRHELVGRIVAAYNKTERGKFDDSEKA